MRRTIAIFIMGLICAIAISNARAASDNNLDQQNSAGRPVVVAQANQPQPKPTEADKKGLADAIQQRYKPGPGAKAPANSMSTQKMQADTAGKCGPTVQIAACSGACAAECIFNCMPSRVNWRGSPWSSDCHSCVNKCMDKCTGCGSGTLQ
jgi:hypothetical protein